MTALDRASVGITGEVRRAEMGWTVNLDTVKAAEREVYEYCQRAPSDPPEWLAAIEIGKELSTPPWELLGESREEREWVALTIGMMAGRNKYTAWMNKRIRRIG